MKKPVIIAEIGCNHIGDMEIAKKMKDIELRNYEIAIEQLSNNTEPFFAILT